MITAAATTVMSRVRLFVMSKVRSLDCAVEVRVDCAVEVLLLLLDPACGVDCAVEVSCLGAMQKFLK
jgi:hypothetical protein